MSKRKKRTAYQHEFKKKAVKMTTKEGITVSDVADELGVSAQCLSRWRRELIEDSGLDLAEKCLDAMSENKKFKDGT